ncbi:uncharacterized protein [Nicotiana sylvestris]|uniref:uncharacterized protein n=1 Tax=Nicotiana sylvestris TaxID=4096 RepID=UPI00388CB25C
MVDPQKIAAVKNWPRPTTPTEIRSFLDLVWYYRRFVEGFSTLVSPLTKLTQKAVKFQWSDACERSFQELKSRLTTTSVLTLLEGGVIMQNRVESLLVAEMKENQFNDPLLAQLKEGIHKHKTIDFSFGMEDGTLRYHGRLCVPDIDGLRETIMEEAHTSRLCGKMFELSASEGRTSKARWIGSKHRNSNVEIGNDQYGFCAFHTQTDEQVEQTIQTLEDMLCACVLDFKGNWDDHFPLIECAYSNSFHASIQMAPFEELYGRRCRSPIGWFKVGEAELIGSDLMHQAMEKFKIIKEFVNSSLRFGVQRR